MVCAEEDVRTDDALEALDVRVHDCAAEEVEVEIVLHVYVLVCKSRETWPVLRSIPHHNLRKGVSQCEPIAALAVRGREVERTKRLLDLLASGDEAEVNERSDSHTGYCIPREEVDELEG